MNESAPTAGGSGHQRKMRDHVGMRGVVVDREGRRVANGPTTRNVCPRIGDIQGVTRIEVQRESVGRVAVDLADLAAGQVERRIDVARGEIDRLDVGQRRKELAIADRTRIGGNIDGVVSASAVDLGAERERCIVDDEEIVAPATKQVVEPTAAIDGVVAGAAGDRVRAR
jgi:YbbR domain-containing protein